MKKKYTVAILATILFLLITAIMVVCYYRRDTNDMITSSDAPNGVLGLRANQQIYNGNSVLFCSLYLSLDVDWGSMNAFEKQEIINYAFRMSQKIVIEYDVSEFYVFGFQIIDDDRGRLLFTPDMEHDAVFIYDNDNNQVDTWPKPTIYP
jgi:hypothetical protein